MSTALLVVDVQNDFCEGGALAVAGGAGVAQAITDHLAANPGTYDVVVATADWHNPLPDTNDGHFADGEPNYVTTWPVHCVADTPGAEFHPALSLPTRVVTVRKGTGRQDYSGFEGRIVHAAPKGVGLATFLHEVGVTTVDVVGLATDHCVKATALDANEAGFAVRVLTDLTAAVSAPTAVQALTELAQAGVTLTTSKDPR